MASTARYYRISPLDVEAWKTRDILDWHNEAVKLENEKAKAIKKATDGQKS